MRHRQIITESSNLQQPPERYVRSSSLFLDVAFYVTVLLVVSLPTQRIRLWVSMLKG